MPLVLIDGLPATGKTSACYELRNRGFEAYDGDEDSLAHWIDKATGDTVPQEEEERTAEFVDSHVRTIPRKTLEELGSRALDKPLFISNDPEDVETLLDLFPIRFALVLDEAVRIARLGERTNNSWGKLLHEREHDLYFVQRAPHLYRDFDYITIDASQPTNRIADQILLGTQARA